jgi:hypothetical protein
MLRRGSLLRATEYWHGSSAIPQRQVGVNPPQDGRANAVCHVGTKGLAATTHHGQFEDAEEESMTQPPQERTRHRPTTKRSHDSMLGNETYKREEPLAKQPKLWNAGHGGVQQTHWVVPAPTNWGFGTQVCNSS